MVGRTKRNSRIITFDNPPPGDTEATDESSVTKPEAKPVSETKRASAETNQPTKTPGQTSFFSSLFPCLRTPVETNDERQALMPK